MISPIRHLLTTCRVRSKSKLIASLLYKDFVKKITVRRSNTGVKFPEVLMGPSEVIRNRAVVGNPNGPPGRR